MSHGAQATCRACSEMFVSVKAFDFHRVGSFERQKRRCLTVRQMRTNGMIQDEKSRWTLPATPPAMQQYTPQQVVQKVSQTSV